MRRAAAIAAVVLVLGCGREPKAPDVGSDAVRVRVAVSPALKFAPFMIGKDAGLFAAEGIDLQFVSLDTASAFMATTSGDLDVYAGPVRSGVFNAILRGAQVRVVADAGHFEPRPCAPEAFVAPVALADRILASSDGLRGARVSMIRGGVTEYLIHRFVAMHGLQSSDVEFSEQPQGDLATRANRQVDAVRYLSEPHVTNQVSAGLVKVVASSQDVAPGHQHALLIYGRRLLTEDEDLGHRFMRAWLRAVRRYNEGATPSNVASVARHTRLPEEIVRRSCWMPIADDGVIRPDAIEPILAWFLSVGYLDSAIAAGAWWEPRFAAAANREGGGS